MGTIQDPSIVAAHNNLIRAMAFASEHQEEPTESGLNNENSNDFTDQPWSRYKSNPAQHSWQNQSSNPIQTATVVSRYPTGSPAA
eukprot:10746210-Heterocapsa_arctica.AAC.1